MTAKTNKENMCVENVAGPDVLLGEGDEPRDALHGKDVEGETYCTAEMWRAVVGRDVLLSEETALQTVLRGKVVVDERHCSTRVLLTETFCSARTWWERCAAP